MHGNWLQQLWSVSPSQKNRPIGFLARQIFGEIPGLLPR